MKPVVAFLKRLFQKVSDDAITDSSAQLSYYFLFALFPFLVVLVTVAAYLPLEGAVDDMMSRLDELMPASALEIVRTHLQSLVGTTRPNLLTLGLFTAIWSASRGVDAIRKALNLAYDVPESRPFWKTQGLAILMTVAGAILILLSFAMILLGGRLGFFVADKLHVASQFAWLWSWLRWPSTALVVMLALALTYFVLPDVKQKFKYITPGSVTGTLLWLVSTWGFTKYVEHFGKYNVTYGSIGGVIILLLWLYITGLILLFGGELNALLEHESEGGKAKGARAEEELPLPKDQRPSAAPPSLAKKGDSSLPEPKH